MRLGLLRVCDIERFAGKTVREKACSEYACVNGSIVRAGRPVGDSRDTWFFQKKRGAARARTGSPRLACVQLTGIDFAFRSPSVGTRDFIQSMLGHFIEERGLRPVKDTDRRWKKVP